MYASLAMVLFVRTVDGLDNIYADNIEAQQAVIGTVAFEDVVTQDINAATLTISGASSLNTLAVSGASTTGAITSSGAISGTALTASGPVTAASVSGGVMTGTSIAVTGAATSATVAATGAITGASLGVTGAVTSASVTASGAVTAASVSGGAITGTSVGVTGAVTCASVSATGAVTAASVSGGAMTGTTLTLSGNLAAAQATFGGHVVFTTSTVIRQNTVDGSDTNFITICGGGDIGSSRGGRIIVRGNEAADAGKVQIRAGDNGGRIEFGTNGDILRGTVEQDGTWTMTSTTATTSSSTGALRISGGFSTSLTTDATSATNGGTITTPGGAAIAKSLWVGTTLNVAGTTTGAAATFSGTVTGGAVTTAGTVTGAILYSTNYIQLKNCFITSSGNDMYLNGNGGLVALRPNNNGNFTVIANPTNVQVTDGAGVAKTTITNGGDIACISVTATGTLASGTSITAGTDVIVGNVLTLKSASLSSTGNDLVLNGNVGVVRLRPNNNANNALYVNPTNVEITNASGVVKTTISSGGAIACDSVTTTGNITAARFIGGDSGSFTPNLSTDTTITYTERSGFWYRVGKMVFITLKIITTSEIAIGVRSVTVLNLPFNNGSGQQVVSTVMLENYPLPTSTDFVVGRTTVGFNSVNVYACKDDLAAELLTAPTTAATRTIWITTTFYIP